MIKPELINTDNPDVNGKNILIVGGTHGVGMELAKMCHEWGGKVIVIGKTRNNDIGHIPQITMDVTKESPEYLFKRADFVFNNIGQYYKGTIKETDVDKFMEIVENNLRVTYELTRYALMYMKRGVLVNMASRPELEKYHSWSAYTLAKQGIITLTKSASEEGEIKAYAVCPSRINTKFRDELFPEEDLETRLSPKEVAELIFKLFNGKNPTGQHYWIKKIKEQNEHPITTS